MKKIIAFASLLLCVGILSFTSCSSDEKMDESIPVNPVLSPIKAVVAEDGSDVATAVISDATKTIKLSLMNVKSLEAVKVRISFSKRAKLITPTDTILTLDLRNPYQIVVNNLYKDLTYTLTAALKFEVPKANFKEYKLNNDGTALDKTNILNLWNNEIMYKVEDYGTIAYRNYYTLGSFTVDLGGSYKIARFQANLYWALTNVCPKTYELYGYSKEGVPPLDGNWNDWTLLGSLDNTGKTIASFAQGDILNIAEDEAQVVRYVRVRCKTNYKSPSSTYFSLCEITFWAYVIK